MIRCISFLWLIFYTFLFLGRNVSSSPREKGSSKKKRWEAWTVIFNAHTWKGRLFESSGNKIMFFNRHSHTHFASPYPPPSESSRVKTKIMALIYKFSFFFARDMERICRLQFSKSNSGAFLTHKGGVSWRLKAKCRLLKTIVCCSTKRPWKAIPLLAFMGQMLKR